MALAVGLPAGAYLVTLDPKTQAKAVKNAAARKPPMTVEQYLLWLICGDLKTR